jgi:hypothetical protein
MDRVAALAADWERAKAGTQDYLDDHPPTRCGLCTEPIVTEVLSRANVVGPRAPPYPT